MTVLTELARESFPWTGVETLFTCGFPADKAADVHVFFRTPAGVVSELLAGVNHTVTLAPGTKIVSIVPMALPPAPGTIIVTRETPSLVSEVLQDGNGFSLAIIQQLHDRAAMRSAEDRTRFARAIVLPEGVELGDGNFDFGGSGIDNLAPGETPNSAATVGQIQEIVVGSGNVPSPVLGDVGKVLTAIGTGVFGWVALLISQLSQLADGLFTANVAGRAKFAAGFVDGGLLAGTAVATRHLSGSALGQRCGMLNGKLVQSRAGNAETFAVKTLAGTDASATDPVLFCFQDGAGGYVVRTVTAALSVTASSGSTLGAANATPFRVWVVAADDAGTVRLGIVNARSGTNVMALTEWSPKTSVAEGGAGAADLAQVIYSGTAFATKYLNLVGFSDWDTGLVAAGTWVSAPTRTVTFGAGVARPGDVIDSGYDENVTYGGSAVAIPWDDTIPQVGEGAQILAVNLTPKSAANVIKAHASVTAAPTTVSIWAVAAFLNGAANAVASRFMQASGGSAPAEVDLDLRYALAGLTTQALTIRAGPNTTGTLYFNGGSGSRLGGGTSRCTFLVEEIMG